MPRWLPTIGAVVVGIGGGLLLFATGEETTQSDTSARRSSSAQLLQLETPLPLIKLDNARQAKVSVTEAASGKLIVGTEGGGVYGMQMPFPGESVTIPQEPLTELSARVSDLALSSDGEVYAAISVVNGSLAVATSSGVIAGSVESAYSNVGISPDGGLLALAGFGVRTFDLTSGAAPTDHEQPMMEDGRGTYEDVTVSSAGSVAAVSLEGVDVWGPRSRTTDGATRSCGCAARGVSPELLTW
jgi:WD40 repeat protein